MTVDESPSRVLPLRAKLRAALPSLSRTGGEVARVVLDDPSAVLRMTVSELASASSTSVGSVVRFCQELGLRGFQDLKLELAADTSALTSHRPPPDGSPASIVLDTVQASARAVSDLERVLDVEQLQRVAGLLAGAGQVLVLGVGSSAPLAHDAAYRWQSAGVAGFAPVDVHVQHVTARMLGPGDVCVAISHTGQTHETLQGARAAALGGAATVAITSFARSPLTEAVDEAVVAGAAETAFRVEAMTSRFAHFVVIDALQGLVQHARPDAARAAGALVAETLVEHRL